MTTSDSPCPGWCLPAVQRDSYVGMEMRWGYEIDCSGGGGYQTSFTVQQYSFGCLSSLVLESERSCAPEIVIVNQ